MLPLPLPSHSIKNINFEGQNVRVIMTYATGSSITNGIATGTTALIANIIFDYCGCSGTFATVGIGGHFTFNPAQPPLYVSIRPWTTTGSLYTDPTLRFINYVHNHSNLTLGLPYIFRGGMEIAYSGSYSFEAPYTQLYELHYNFDFFGGGGTVPAGQSTNFSWFAHLYLDDRDFGEISGTASFTEGQSISFAGTWEGFRNVFFQAGERAIFRIEQSFIHNGGTDLLSTLNIKANMNSGLGFHLSPPPIGSGDGAITYFIPLGIPYLD